MNLPLVVAKIGHAVPTPFIPVVEQFVNVTRYLDSQFCTAGFVFINIFHSDSLVEYYLFLLVIEHYRCCQLSQGQ